MINNMLQNKHILRDSNHNVIPIVIYFTFAVLMAYNENFVKIYKEVK